MKKNFLYIAAVLLMTSSIFVSCDKNDKDDPSKKEVVSDFIESPYLICANRNPGGVGFDFWWTRQEGGAMNMDAIKIENFLADIRIKTIKAKKPDGNMAGMPYIILLNGACAINYSAINSDCKGLLAYEALAATSIEKISYKSDATDFDESKVIGGEITVSTVNKEYAKLVIGDRWKPTAHNEVENDEIVWLIKTSEGKIVKMIVYDFPAAGAPTASGYIAIKYKVIS
ncbi:MAG: hypothetical protein WC140_00305 [Bacteroidales bacterium]